MTTIHPKAESKIKSEPDFETFIYNNIVCCVQRIEWCGALNGYVGVPESHPFYGKDYSDNVVVDDIEKVEFNGNYIGLFLTAMKPETALNMISIDMVLNVHGGLTFSDSELNGIDENDFGKLWWFGFDTLHAGDLKPYQDDIDRKFSTNTDVYRDFEYVKKQTISLAEQLSKYGK